MINLNSASRQAIQALNRLREPGNEALVQFFESQLAEAKQKLVYADDMGMIHRLQGRAEAFEDLLKAIEESQKVVNRS
jgi:hypothetical protein